jgi:hypothetical protein
MTTAEAMSYPVPYPTYKHKRITGQPNAPMSCLVLARNNHRSDPARFIPGSPTRLRVEGEGQLAF